MTRKSKGINYKKILVIAIIIMLVVAACFAVKYFIGDDDKVSYETLSQEQVPEKIQEILPRYKKLERALACKVDDEVFVIATRGEKPTGGYAIKIDQIEKVKEEDQNKLVVYTTFKDPQPGSVVTQVITYPYVVVKTGQKDLPDKIELKVRYNEEQ